jgi:hypothetical protein
VLASNQIGYFWQVHTVRVVVQQQSVSVLWLVHFEFRLVRQIECVVVIRHNLLE